MAGFVAGMITRNFGLNDGWVLLLASFAAIVGDRLVFGIISATKQSTTTVINNHAGRDIKAGDVVGGDKK